MLISLAKKVESDYKKFLKRKMIHSQQQDKQTYYFLCMIINPFIFSIELKALESILITDFFPKVI